jgi:uncharacterized protein YciI
MLAQAGKFVEESGELPQYGAGHRERSMGHFLLVYDLSPDYMTRRAALRSEHLKLAWAASARGELILGGALADPVDNALLLFKGDSSAAAEAFAAADPYVRHGLVTKWRVRQWTTVVGELAATPVRPEV